MDLDKFWQYFWRFARLLYVAFIILIGFIVVTNLFQYTYPFIVALVMAYIMNPLVNVLVNKTRLPRGASVFISILAIIVFLLSVVTFLVLELIAGTKYLSEHLPEHFETLVTYIQDMFSFYLVPLYEQVNSFFKMLEPAQQQQLIHTIEGFGDSFAQAGANMLESILKWLPETLSHIPNLATGIVFSVLGTFFISKDWYKWGDRIKNYTPDKIIQSTIHLFNGLQTALFGFIKAQFTLISMTAIIVLIGLLILRVDYAITIAVITGAIDLLPYLGTGLIFVPWIIYMFFTGNYFLTIGLSILYSIVILQRQFMEPKVLSTNINVDPLATLVSLFVGYQVFGFLGLIIGPVLLVVSKTLFKTGIIQEVWDFIIGPKKDI
ncbi:sporulation integral membrane protein YtvI [Pontibacillus litoralis]|uniref:Membrane protein n=1 Tax=Pontibacillus litoralis JSM 072002 TaxID=1385512 RepID=A0A0A5GAR0_9BACI|nr:sporulation integral membrane protein YtvI [Pontibacillus litoralis]KGX89094.1 membrane protein [Pontibacillus litoralis JSM 072002]